MMRHIHMYMYMWRQQSFTHVDSGRHEIRQKIEINHGSAVRQNSKWQVAAIIQASVQAYLCSYFYLSIYLFIYTFIFKSYTLAGFDLTTHSSSLLGGRQRRYHEVDHAARAFFIYFFGYNNFMNQTDQIKKKQS
jgi:hypothetical protein